VVYAQNSDSHEDLGDGVDYAPTRRFHRLTGEKRGRQVSQDAGGLTIKQGSQHKRSRQAQPFVQDIC
jgi:hypothetical protein